jgi:hypothetical protein
LSCTWRTLEKEIINNFLGKETLSIIPEITFFIKLISYYSPKLIFSLIMTIIARLAAIDFPSEMKNISTAQNIVLDLAGWLGRAKISQECQRETQT